MSMKILFTTLNTLINISTGVDKKKLLTAIKTTVFNNIKQIYRELVNTNTDFSFDISKTRGRNTYKATSSNHDCNSRFTLSFRKETDNET